MTAVPFEQLPDALSLQQLGQGLGLSYASMRRMRNRRDWPFSTVPGLPSKGRGARYAKAQVLAILNGQAVPKGKTR